MLYEDYLTLARCEILTISDAITYKGETINNNIVPEMGNKLKQSSFFSKTAMSAIGSISICPNCQQSFPPSTTYQSFDQHVTVCLESFRPSDQERLRMQRRKKSKDSGGSRGSDEDDEKNDYITIQVYVRKKESDNKISTKSSQQKPIQHLQKMSKTGLEKRISESDQKLDSKNKWVKSHLTYSESLLTSLSLAQISKQGTAYKILWFHHRIASQRITWKAGAEVLTFHPEHIVKDSLGLTFINLYKELKIVVINDVVHDAGGLLREWAAMLLQELITTFRLFIRNKEGYYILNPQLANESKLNSTVNQNKQQNKLQNQKPASQKIIEQEIPSSQAWDDDLEIYKIYYNHHMYNEEQVYEDYGLFKNKRNHRINRTVNHTKVTYAQLYELFACLLAKILIEKVTVPVTFDWVFLGGLLSKFAADTNMEAVLTYDKQIHSSLQYLHSLCGALKNPKSANFKQKLSELQSLCLCFSVPASEYQPEIDLIANGKKIAVSNPQQLQKYVKCLQHYYTNTMHENQLKIIKQKFYSVIKPDIFNNLFTCEEFQLLVNGVSDWQDGTEYREPYSKQHKVIRYFWSTVEKMNPDDRVRLLKFVTGSERLPVYGFKNLQTNRGETSHFVIEAVKYDKKTQALPKAHTCFNRLILPTYPNQTILAESLLAVLHSSFDGIWGME